ncbi:O-methyltransferase [Fictibacillus macauensis ZFHKF-1]|uniref:tRNA 5-hydroxyuridine methyltransferase n=1 Tax=Fictibacillus macauensis ZFHKF-1 TaxID=1196324 RepID=I8UEN3_9BACL|nr:O-methyltransferase [Fictibacillus macauensis]EIT85283.1 O-methyltransferase [Fictibacillus macauensis ZFHKF-1]
MISKNIETYLEELIPQRDKEVMELESYAREHEVPIMELIGMEVLLQQLRLLQPKRILEIGSAIGYSAIRMAQTVKEATIVTIERDDERYNVALENIKRFSLEDRITVLHSDANECVEDVAQLAPFDAIFIDAAKGQYRPFFDNYSKYLSSGGVIFSDNILFKGYVADGRIAQTRRLRALIRKIQSYNEFLMQHPEYETAILPVGDGLAISVKK